MSEHITVRLTKSQASSLAVVLVNQIDEYIKKIAEAEEALASFNHGDLLSEEAIPEVKVKIKPNREPKPVIEEKKSDFDEEEIAKYSSRSTGKGHISKKSSSKWKTIEEAKVLILKNLSLDEREKYAWPKTVARFKEPWAEGVPAPQAGYIRYSHEGVWKGYPDYMGYERKKFKGGKVGEAAKKRKAKPTRADMNEMFSKAGLGKPEKFEDPPSWKWITDLIKGLLEMKENRYG